MRWVQSQRKAIGGLIRKVASWNPTRDAPEAEFAYIDLSALNNATKTVTGIQTVQGRNAPSRARQLVKSGDILVSTVRPNLNGVARVPEKLDGATASTGFCVLRPEPSKLDESYLFHWVRSHEFVADMVRKSTGASYPAVSDRIIGESEIPLPPLAEQRRIAAILDQADDLRRKRQRALDRLSQLGQAIFMQMFGDPATNPMGWPDLSLGEMAEKFSDGPFGSNLKSEHYVEQGVRVIRLQNIGTGEFLDEDKAYISDQHFLSLSKHTCLPGDVLVGTMGDPNLRACLLPEHLKSAINKADCVQIRPNITVASNFYICGLLNHPSTERMAHDLILGQTRARISMGRLKGLRVPCPPVSLQETFGTRITSLTGLRSDYQDALFHSENLFQALQHRAFNGELTTSSLKDAVA